MTDNGTDTRILNCSAAQRNSIKYIVNPVIAISHGLIVNYLYFFPLRSIIQINVDHRMHLSKAHHLLDNSRFDEIFVDSTYTVYTQKMEYIKLMFNI